MTIQRYFIGDAFDLLQSDQTEYDAIITDPPYQFETSGGGIAKERELWGGGLLKQIGSSKDFRIMRFMPYFQERCNPLVLIQFCSKTELSYLLPWAEKGGFNWDVLTWHKRNPIPFKNNHILHDTEFIFYCREPGTYFPNDLPWKMLKSYYFVDSPRRQIGRGQRAGKSVEHPCTKPMAIMENLVRLATPRGAHILDPFAGSGTTLKAASKHGRDSTGYEIDAKWEPLLKEVCSSIQSELFRLDEECVAEQVIK